MSKLIVKRLAANSVSNYLESSWYKTKSVENIEINRADINPTAYPGLRSLRTYNIYTQEISAMYSNYAQAQALRSFGYARESTQLGPFNVKWYIYTFKVSLEHNPGRTAFPFLLVRDTNQKRCIHSKLRFFASELLNWPSYNAIYDKGMLEAVVNYFNEQHPDSVKNFELETQYRRIQI